MKRRIFLKSGFALACGAPLLADMNEDKLNAVARLLQQNLESDVIEASTIYVRHRESVFSRSFGAAKSENAIYLLASISKPISVAAVMTLYDQGLFDLDEPANKYLDDFTRDGRDRITIRDLMTHISGLPDQLPENQKLRSTHKPLSEFVKYAIKTPLLFEPKTQYSYSSMAILLATEIAQRVSGKSIHELMQQAVLTPLEMKHTALGIGGLDPDSFMRCQVEKAAPESGAGSPAAKDWDWNSDYWRKLGAPWGGAHGSAADVARFLDAFMHPQGKCLKLETARLMIRNHNPNGLRPRGLGFDLGKRLGGWKTSDATFGHGGSTGTLCWADPETDTTFVILTTLPAAAVKPHPREAASKLVAEAVE